MVCSNNGRMNTETLLLNNPTTPKQQIPGSQKTNTVSQTHNPWTDKIQCIYIVRIHEPS